MIESTTIALDYIKKEEYFGSYKGMRYRLAKAVSKTIVVQDGEEVEQAENVIEVTIWPEPYNFTRTPAEKKQTVTFPLSQEGKEEAVCWLNEQYKEQKPLWDMALC